MSNLITIARPYAKAAFNFAYEQKLVNKWKEMLFYVTQVINVPDVKNIMLRTVDKHLFTKFFLKLCDNDIDKYFKNFIKIIIKNKRLCLLNNIYDQVMEYSYTKNNITNIEILTVKKLSKKSFNYINSAFKKTYITKVMVKNTLDSLIIGGLICKSKDYVINDSINLHLKKLEKFLKN